MNSSGIRDLVMADRSVPRYNSATSPRSPAEPFIRCNLSTKLLDAMLECLRKIPPLPIPRI